MSIGTELTAARERAGLSVEELSAATRIRTGLIAAMEADDFSRCGGTFYARGHIRAIARAVQTDPTPLLALFDEAHPAVEADLAHRQDRAEARKPTLHAARPRWAFVVGAILVALLGWGMVRLFTLPSDVEANASRSTPTAAVTTVTHTPPVAAPTPTARPSGPATPAGPRKVVVMLRGADEGAYVTLRNYHGELLFQGLVGTGSTQTVTYPGSIRVTLGNTRNVRLFVNNRRVTPPTKRFLITPTGAIDKTP